MVENPSRFITSLQIGTLLRIEIICQSSWSFRHIGFMKNTHSLWSHIALNIAMSKHKGAETFVSIYLFWKLYIISHLYSNQYKFSIRKSMNGWTLSILCTIRYRLRKRRERKKEWKKGIIAKVLERMENVKS